MTASEVSLLQAIKSTWPHIAPGYEVAKLAAMPEIPRRWTCNNKFGSPSAAADEEPEEDEEEEGAVDLPALGSSGTSSFTSMQRLLGSVGCWFSGIVRVLKSSECSTAQHNTVECNAPGKRSWLRIEPDADRSS